MLQTPAERHLVTWLRRLTQSRPGGAAHLLNIGAGQSLSIESQLLSAGCAIDEDRLDIERVDIAHPCIHSMWTCSVEDMAPVPAAAYDVAFSNYLLEHVRSIPAAIREVHRVLRPGGHYIATLPNPSAPPFAIARLTPLRFHRLVRGVRVWPTYYAYRSIPRLARLFEGAGFDVVEVRRWSFLEGYSRGSGVLRAAMRACDRVVDALPGGSFLRGEVCVVVRKPA